MTTRVGRLLAVVGVAVLLLQLFYWLPNHIGRDTATTDVMGYYRAASHVLHRESLYREVLDGGLGAYIYPPTFAVFIAPLGFLSPGAFQAVWYVGILFAFWLYAAGLVRLAGRPHDVAHVLAAGALLMLVPGTATTMSYGNIDLLVWALCAWSLTEDSAWAGAWLGLAGVFKIYPSWVLLVRDRRTQLAGVCTALGLVACTLAAVGAQGVVDWFKVVRLLGRGIDWHTNVSLSFHVARLTGCSDSTAVIALCGTVGGAIGSMMAVAALGGSPQTRAAAGAVMLVAAMLLSPICWVHYAPVLLIPTAVVWSRR